MTQTRSIEQLQARRAELSASVERRRGEIAVIKDRFAQAKARAAKYGATSVEELNKQIADDQVELDKKTETLEKATQLYEQGSYLAAAALLNGVT